MLDISQADSFLTKEGYERIKEELNNLKISRSEIAEKIREAREQGSIVDNAMYDSYIEEQGYIEGRIAELEEVIGKAQIIEVDRTAGAILSAGLGNIIRVKYNNQEETFTLVSSAEADPMQKRISVESPVGKALFGAKVGDVILVETPQLKIEYHVQDIN